MARASRLATRRLSTGAVAGGLLAGCMASIPSVPPYAPRAPERDDARVSEAQAAHMPALPERVRVRLAAHDGAQRMIVAGASREPLELERRGSFVLASDGRLVERLVLDPRDERRGMEVAERVYPGSLRVEAGPDFGLRVWALVPLEEYVEGVVASELPLWSAHPAEIEALAIVARTYAARAMQLRGELFDSTRDQAYRGRPALSAAAAARGIGERLRAGVESTRGIVLMLDGALLDGRYHAACGGFRGDHARVFPDGGRGARPSACEPCMDRARAEIGAGEPAAQRPLMWRFTAGEERLAALARELGLGARLLGLSPTEIDQAGRWIEVELCGERGRRRLSMIELRARLGDTELKSGRILRLWPPAGRPIESGLFFEGLGRGHGVGLCQEGSHDQAAAGWTARAILEQAYPGAQLERLSTAEA